MNKYKITYFPLEQMWSVWQQFDGKAPVCINGYDTKNWFHTLKQARDWCKKNKIK